MGTAQGGYGGGGMGGSSNYGNAALANIDSGSFNPYFGGSGMGQQPAYGMGTGGQYSPQLRQAQTAWQDMYSKQMAAPPATGSTEQPTNPYNSNIQIDPALQQMLLQQSQRQPYGMGAQGNGNAYGYGGQQSNPWAQMSAPARFDPSSLAYALDQAPQTRIAQANNPLVAPWLTGNQPPPAQPFGVPMQQGSTSFSPPPVSQPQAPLQAPRPAAPPPPAAPTRANYSPNNPFAGMYATPQGDAWEQQQRGGAPAAPVPATPAPAAPGTDVMRKALAAGVPNQGTNPGYGYGTPGGYQFDTAPSTLDPGSMNALLGIMGGNINGVGYPTSAANYANWYQQTYGTQAPGGPRAYPF